MERSGSAKIFDQLSDAQRKYDRSLDQINVLELQLRDLGARYKRAAQNKKNSFRYNLRLKLSVVTGIKMMYTHFATKKDAEIQQHRRQLQLLYGNGLRNYNPRDQTRQPNIPQEMDSDHGNEADNEDGSSSTPSESSASSQLADQSSSDTCP